MRTIIELQYRNLENRPSIAKNETGVNISIAKYGDTCVQSTKKYYKFFSTRSIEYS